MYKSFYQEVEDIKARLAPRHLSEIFGQCFTNTLETTVEIADGDDGSTFVFTGDIPAMWLRDSTAQVRPYLPFCRKDEDLKRMVAGLIRRQARCMIQDPYANAFNKTADGKGHQTDKTVMNGWIWERKFELDSLCYPVQLIYDYWKSTDDAGIFDQILHRMFYRILEVMTVEQHHDSASPYRFERDDRLLPSDTLPFGGKGTRTNFTGMVWSGFRPSDDACKFGYLIPANMFAVVILGHIADISEQIYRDANLRELALKLRDEIDFGIRTYGKALHPVYGEIFAYETDGYGNYNFMDDANIPSLLSIPYIGYLPVDDPIYQNTRSFILSEANPYYYKGKYAHGIGSPHTPPNYIWPLSLIMQGLTSTNREEMQMMLEILIHTTAESGFMHESFDPDRPQIYTREWFSWANSLFGEFVLKWLAGKETSVNA